MQPNTTRRPSQSLSFVNCSATGLTWLPDLRLTTGMVSLESVVTTCTGKSTFVAQSPLSFTGAADGTAPGLIDRQSPRESMPGWLGTDAECYSACIWNPAPIDPLSAGFGSLSTYLTMDGIRDRWTKIRRLRKTTTAIEQDLNVAGLGLDQVEQPFGWRRLEFIS